jgi:NADPH:quinone reductase-like Zn-dependent oxidoreductase
MHVCEETMMTDQREDQGSMRTLRFHEYGKAGDVLRLETAPVPETPAGRIRVAVAACAVAPADWALCGGLFGGGLPRGIGIDVSGSVDEVGEAVNDVQIGDLVLGNADWRGVSCAGASDYAIMDRWVRVPAGLDLEQAAALPMAVDTAYLHLTLLGLDAGKTILINGAGSTIGFAAVQIALARGLSVIATAGETHAKQLREFGAIVTGYGDGVVERVRAVAPRPVDLVLDTSPVGGALPDLIRIAGDPTRVLTCGGSVPEAAALGARDSFHEVRPHDLDALPEFVALAADGRFSVPVAQTFRLEEWRSALKASESGHARGKLLLIPEQAAKAS